MKEFKTQVPELQADQPGKASPDWLGCVPSVHDISSVALGEKGVFGRFPHYLIAPTSFQSTVTGVRFNQESTECRLNITL